MKDDQHISWKPLRLRRALVAVLVGALILTGAGLIVLHVHPGVALGASGQDDLTVGGPSATVEAGGLTLSLRLSPGPYFVGELVVARMTLANGTPASYILPGAPQANDCGQTIGAVMSGGVAPTYTLPTIGSVYCPFYTSTLHSGQTWTINQFLPLTASGNVTLTAQSSFMITTTGADGTTYETGSSGPFTRGWPTLHLSVAPTAPAGRTISLHLSSQSAPAVVTTTAPAAASAHLYNVYDVTCHTGGQSSEERPSLTWLPTGGTTLREPECQGYGEVWSYSVGAPGYAIASGKYPPNA